MLLMISNSIVLDMLFKMGLDCDTLIINWKTLQTWGPFTNMN